MAKAKRKPITPARRKRRTTVEPPTSIKRGEPGPLAEGYLEPLSADEVAQMCARAAQRQELSREFDRALIDADRGWPPKSARRQSADSRISTKTWIKNAAKAMKAAGEIPADIRISDFARSLAGEMKQAAGIDLSIRLVDWHHIKNMLRAWGLWPISAIK